MPYGTLVPQTYKNKAPAVIRVRRSRTSAKFAAGAFVVLNAKMPPAGKRLMALLPYDSSSETLVQFFFQVILHIGQALQQQRVKRSALAVQDHLHSFFVGKCFLITAFTRQRIIHIGQRDQLCADGNFIPLQPIRVAASIPASLLFCSTFILPKTSANFSSE